MQTWIALLRGINVGGKHIVPMKELRQLLEADGFTNVQTYIQSGNVVLDSPDKPEDKIGELIERQFGFKPSVFALSGNDLKDAAANNPYQPELGKQVHFFFLEEAPDSVDYDLLDTLKTGSEAYELIEKVFYLYAPDGIGRSKLAEKMSKAFPPIAMTARNLNTINKLLEMIG
ncbi:MAG: DUF1697 domain-containing protein [Saprospiraceae bacterium]|nr:DUF1697 domain-containing protein [Lewinella sp.]